MLAKTCKMFAAVAATALALLGIVLFPGLLLGWAVVAAVLGGVVAIWSHLRRPEAGPAVRVGAVAAAVVMALALAVTGSIVLIGGATAWVVPSLLGLGGLLGFRRRRSRAAPPDGLLRPKQAAAPPTTPPDPGRPTRGHSAAEKRETRRGEPPRAVPPVLAQLPSLPPGALSTSQLCGAWQRSYWLLLDLPAGPSRDEVVRLRHHVLDELERRDPTGFGRWLQTEPRAGSHPGNYLVPRSEDHLTPRRPSAGVDEKESPP